MIRNLALLLMLCGLFGAAPALAAEARDPYTHFFNPNTGDLKDELADAKSAGKTAVFLMFEQEGCPGCIHMKTHVLSHPEVQKFYRSRFLNFAIDIHSSVPLTDFAGRGHTEKSYAQSARVKGTPTLVFHDLAGNEVVRIVGTIREADEFLLLGEFVASGAYKTRKFAEFKQHRRPEKGS
ncbi:MAG: thioredoxin fold domain-containing protein [Betaproteobacteria bacterium]|nr:thioredoxin fold domain-containing protein [Betaproteobacteria bacterium]